MAVTKIHPIEKTLYLALDYIMNEDKTDEKILISSFAYNPKTAHREIPCRVSSDPHEWRNDGHTVSSRDSAKLKWL